MARISESLNQIVSSAETAASSLEDLNKSVLESQNILNSALASADDFANSLNSLGEALNILTKPIFGVGEGLNRVAQALGTTTEAIAEPIRLVRQFTNFYKVMIQTGDQFTQAIRSTDAAMYDLAASFGATYQEAQSFRNQFIDTAATVNTSEFGFVNVRELRETFQELSNAGITVDKFSDSISSSAGNVDLLTNSFLQARAMGISVQTYMSSLSEAIMKQGLTSEQAASQMALFSDISDDTGLKVDKVADNLNSLASNFTTMGLSADFGEPLLRGFSDTLSNMNLGIENSIELTQNLGSALAGLTTNYSTAFVTMNRGGGFGGIGGGSALGAGIQFQEKLLEAQQSGDKGQQAQLAAEMAGMMKDTLSQFTGGRIVTVSEAAANPALETTFFTQTKLLENLYGIDEKNAARTLELLTNLDSAIASGDTEQAQMLGEQLRNAVDSRNDTLSGLEKLDNTLSGDILSNMKDRYSELQGIKEQTEVSAVNLAKLTSEGLNIVYEGAIDTGITNGLVEALKGTDATFQEAEQFAKDNQEIITSLISKLSEVNSDESIKKNAEIIAAAVQKAVTDGFAAVAEKFGIDYP